MGGALLIWAGLTDNSIIELVKGIFGQSSSKPAKPTNPAAPATGAAGGGAGRKH